MVGAFVDGRHCLASVSFVLVRGQCQLGAAIDPRDEHEDDGVRIHDDGGRVHDDRGKFAGTTGKFRG
jgi:hypothetical protein